MVKKKIIAGLLTSASILGVCTAGGAVSAAEVDSVDTTVGIGFSGHAPGPNPGPLELKWAPISLDFGSSNTVNTATEAFAEESGSKKYVVVKDERAGQTDKWQVSAKLGNLMSGTAQLAGATLKFDTALQGYQGDAAPESPGSIVPPEGTATTVVAASLDQGASAQVLFEDGTAGSGTYQGASAMEMNNIKLEVPGNIAVAGKQYTGTLTWSLDDTV